MDDVWNNYTLLMKNRHILFGFRDQFTNDLQCVLEMH